MSVLVGEASLCIKQIREGHSMNVYMVDVPEGHNVTELELVTRCDNNIPNLSQHAGQKLHFGGQAKDYGSSHIFTGGRTFKVFVYTD